MAKAEDHFSDHLKIVGVWRDLVRHLEDAEGARTIDEMMMAELGERGAADAWLIHF